MKHFFSPVRNKVILMTFAMSVGNLYAIAAPIRSHQLQQTIQQVAQARILNPTTAEIVFNNGEILTVDFYGDNIFRLFRDNNGGIVRNPQANPPASILVEQPRKPLSHRLQIDKTQEGYRLNTSRLAVNINSQTGLFTVFDKLNQHTVLTESAPMNITKDKTSLTFAAHPDEYFYGGGVQNGHFSHKGQVIAIENTNNWVDGGVASPSPYYWSTAGYGLLWNTFKPGVYDFGAKEKNQVLLYHSANHLDVFVMVDKEPAQLLADYYQLTGHPVLLPKFGFYEGHLNAYNRDYWTPSDKGFMLFEDGKRYNESQKDNGGIKESLNGENNNYQFSARAAIDRYIKHDMPLGWFLPNDGYGAGYGQTSTLDGNIQNLKSFGDYARSKGVEIGLWTQSDLHPKEGVSPLLQRDIVKEVRDAGVRVLKTDVAWVGAGYSFGLNGVTDVGKIMPYYGDAARPFIITLDGWAGTQRYAGVWSGDQTGGDWEYIRFHIPTFIGSGLSGQPNITCDMDGIFGGKNLPVNVRDYQWKTFTPMELNMDGWGSTPKYPMVLGEPAASINRSYLKLKAMLLPYAYTIAHEAVHGKPMVRAMFLDYPNPYTLGTHTEYQFLYGPYLLVAPIYKDTQADKQGNDIRNGIYLPEGEWIDFYDGQIYKGNRIINNYDAPLWKLPVFVKAGAIIPMTNPNNNPSQIRKDYRAYLIYPSGNTTFTQYDDDGLTQAYLNGASTQTPLSSALNGTKLKVTIGKTNGNYQGFIPEKETELFINASTAPKHIVAKWGKSKIKLQEAKNAAEYQRLSNVYYFDLTPNLNRFATPGSDFAQKQILRNPLIRIKTDKRDITAEDLTIEVDGYAYNPINRMETTHGTLTAPDVSFPEKNLGPTWLTPTWKKVKNADYYEIEYDGQLYSTIRQTHLTFEGLTPETNYQFRVRAVNNDGVSPWTDIQARTTVDPYQWAIKHIIGSTSCPNQPGQSIAKLFDGDQKTVWHTQWDNHQAVPFVLTMDLGSVNQLDSMEYMPREDSGNGTILKGTYEVSTDNQTWSAPQPFTWQRNGETKTLIFANHPKARYVRLNITEAVGNYGSGREIYVYKVPGTESVLQGDINRDKRIDDNDFTSYMNYTGLRKKDADFDYVSIGDINRNDLIDAYDISTVATLLDGGVRHSGMAHVSGSLLLTPNKNTFNAGDDILITVSGIDLKNVNALSFGLPYNPSLLTYEGMELVGMKDMVNLTYDRQHSDGEKELFPCFVNRGNDFLLESGKLFVLKFKAKKAGKLTLKPQDGILVDRNLNSLVVF